MITESMWTFAWRNLKSFLLNLSKSVNRFCCLPLYLLYNEDSSGVGKVLRFIIGFLFVFVKN